MAAAVADACAPRGSKKAKKGVIVIVVVEAKRAGAGCVQREP